MNWNMIALRTMSSKPDCSAWKLSTAGIESAMAEKTAFDWFYVYAMVTVVVF